VATKKLSQKDREDLISKLKESFGELEDDDKNSILDSLSNLKPWKKGDTDRRKNDRRKPAEKSGPFSFLR
jgi:hypothetical protein